MILSNYIKSWENIPLSEKCPSTELFSGPYFAEAWR